MKFNGLIRLKVNDFLQLKCLGFIGTGCYIFSRIAYALNFKNSAVEFLLRSIRYSYLPSSQALLSRMVNQDGLRLIDHVSRPAVEKDAVGRAIILSPPQQDGEKVIKGVILLTFTHTFSFFLKHPKWEKLNKYFLFVLEPSWAGYADPDIIAFLQEAEHCILQASEVRDRSFVNGLFPHVPCMETGASNWVDERLFTEGSSELDGKEYDSIYIANLTPFKRVLKAIKFASIVKQKDPDYKMAIVCASWGGVNKDVLLKYSRKLGVEENVVIYKGMKQAKLVELVRKAKCSILLTLKEGSNRVLFESMFVNVPVICISENIGVNKSYINAETGVLTTDKLVPNALIYMSKNYTNYRPKFWALDNISADKTTSYLSSLIESWFPGQINTNLFVKVNSPEVGY
ncbi:MAG: glycosyltransferase, partial [Alkalibacterium sp.]|nr:glycosyltransferase [Alkalibacterium sp.]